MEHLPGEPQIMLIFPLVTKSRNLYCSCCPLSLLSLFIFLLFICTHKYSTVIPECENFLMLLLASRRPTPDSTCRSSSEMMFVSLGSPCNSSLEIFSVIIFLKLIFSIFPKLMRYQRCFSEEHFSGGKMTFRYLCI